MSKHLLLFASILLLSGCVTRQIDRQQFPLPTSAQQLEQWELEGRIALKNGKEGFSAGLHWNEAASAFHFELTGPLGETRARLAGSPGLATLELPNEPVLTSASTEALLADHFGWAVPIESLKFWVRGLPSKDAEAIEFDAQGQLSKFISNGWHVRYIAWQEVQGLQLPKRLEATNQEMSIKLALHDWIF